MQRLGWLLAVALTVMATTAAAREFDPAPINAFQPGVTTKDEAEAALGEPDTRMPSLNDHSTLIYEYEVQPTAENNNISNITIVLLFDPDGKFVRYRAYTRD